MVRNAEGWYSVVRVNIVDDSSHTRWKGGWRVFLGQRCFAFDWTGMGMGMGTDGAGLN